MALPEHWRVITETRALGYEIDRLSDAGYARALGLTAILECLRESCRVEVGEEPDREALLAPAVQEPLEQLRECVDEARQLREELAIAHGERTRPYSLHPYEEFTHAVDAAAMNSYFLFARESGVLQENIRKYPGCCYDMFYLVQHELRKRGIETEHMWWFSAGNNHHFLKTVNVPGETFMIDPTWQQFLPKETDYTHLPQVLIAPTDRMESALALHGVPESRRAVWREARVDSRESDPSYWNRVLSAIFANDPWLPAAVELP